MIPKSGYRFSEKIMLQQCARRPGHRVHRLSGPQRGPDLCPANLHSHRKQLRTGITERLKFATLMPPVRSIASPSTSWALFGDAVHRGIQNVVDVSVLCTT